MKLPDVEPAIMPRPFDSGKLTDAAISDNLWPPSMIAPLAWVIEPSVRSASACDTLPKLPASDEST